jgi:hypothetical protein
MNTQRSVSRYGTSGRTALCVSASTCWATSTPAAPSVATPAHAFAEADVISALQTFEDVWGQLFPAEQTRIVQLLVRRVTVTSEGLVIDVRTDGVSGVMRDMMAPRKKVAAE